MTSKDVTVSTISFDDIYENQLANVNEDNDDLPWSVHVETVPKADKRQSDKRQSSEDYIHPQRDESMRDVLVDLAKDAAKELIPLFVRLEVDHWEKRKDSHHRESYRHSNRH